MYAKLHYNKILNDIILSLEKSKSLNGDNVNFLRIIYHAYIKN